MTTLAFICLIAAGCGPRPTGLLSLDLDSLAVTVAVSGPASIEGVPRQGLDPVEIALISSASGVERLELHCPQTDSASAAVFLLDQATVPSVVRVSDRRMLVADQPGISWTPRYSWTPEGGRMRIEANVILNNSTGQTWNTISMCIIDNDGLSLASTSDAISIPPGDTVVPWWSSSGEVLEPVLIYSWPVPARWNALVPILAETAGPVLHYADDPAVWPIASGDTLWIPLEVLEIEEGTTQTSWGYETETILTNTSDSPLEILVRYPEALSSGAAAYFDVEDRITIEGEGGGSFTFTGSIRYGRRG